MIDDFPAKRLVLLDGVGLIQYAVMLVGAKAAASETIRNIVHSQTIENIVRIDGIVHKKTSLTDYTSTIEFIRIIDLTSDAVHTVFHSFSAGDIFARL